MKHELKYDFVTQLGREKNPPGGFGLERETLENGFVLETRSLHNLVTPRERHPAYGAQLWVLH